MRRLILPAVLTAVLGLSACAASDPILSPSFAGMATAAPDSFDVRFETSAGPIDVRFMRNWAPLGVDRMYYLTRFDFFEGSRFYRVLDNFVAQFGGSGDAATDSLWRTMSLNDEPVRTNNTRGTISFARAGARTRSFTLFINLRDNPALDTDDRTQNVVGYPPVGRVISGMDIVESLYSGYGNISQRDLTADYLRSEYPEMDSIATTTITRVW